ncbi:MAG: hypothetical protein IT291_00060 [Deltaproteobacteria bacterium]|nr:hypothetical protein [Deltaproteobacteria bacterium]
MRRVWFVTVFVGFFAMSGCSMRSSYSSEGLIGTLIGTGVGGGLGYFLGDQADVAKEGAIAGGAVGAGLGLLAGGLMYDDAQLSRHEVVVRKSLPVSDTSKQIDAIRNQVYDSSSWGNNETKSWNERYLGKNPNIPYQGPASPTFR